MLRAAAIALFCLHLAGPAGAGQVEILSATDPKSPSGAVDGGSPDLSADGRYVAFLSASPNVLAGQSDGNNGRDVFLHDRVAGTTILVSHADGSASAAGNGPSTAVVLSADGRYTAFISSASDLAASQSDTSGTDDVFLYDRIAGTTTLVSHVAGLAAEAAAGFPDGLGISDDGRWIAYTSTATDLVSGQADPGFNRDAFLYDRVTGASLLASHTLASSTAAAGGCPRAALSADGAWIAFESSATTLTAGTDLNATEDVFLFERATGAVTLVSHLSSSATTTANGRSFQPALSGSGGWVAFVSFAPNLAAGQSDANGDSDVFLWERATGTTTLVSHSSSSDNVTASGFSDFPALSDDGRYVAFVSDGSNVVSPSELVPSGDAGWMDVFLYDRTTGDNRLASHMSGDLAAPGDADSLAPSISADGTRVAFRSQADDLAEDQSDDGVDYDVFLFDLASGEVALVSHAIGSESIAGSLPSADPRISADGSRVAYASEADDMVPGVFDPNRTWDLFLYDAGSEANAQLSIRGGGPSTTAGGFINPSTATAVSNDGRYVAFMSDAANLVTDQADLNRTFDVFLRDRRTGTTELVSRTGNPDVPVSGSGSSNWPMVSTDGSTVAFVSAADDLVPGQVNLTPWNLFLYSRSSRAVTLVSRASGAGSTTANGDLVSGYAMSGDGRWIVYSSPATNLLPGGLLDGQLQVFLFDRNTSQTTLVSHTPASPNQPANGDSFWPDISADGRWIVFFSFAGNVTASGGGTLLYDRQTGTVTRIAGSGDYPRISADGRWVAFLSAATNLIPGQVDGNGGNDVFLWERATGVLTLASRSTASVTTTGNGVSAFSFDLSSLPVPQVLSADGRYVAFLSQATNLAAGQSDVNAGPDVFLFDRMTGSTTLASHAAGASATAGNGGSSSFALSPNGSRIAFTSVATNLVASQADVNGAGDVFLFDRLGSGIALASRTLASAAASGNGPSAAFSLPRLSADGGVVAFHSAADNLVGADFDAVTSVFAYVTPDPGTDLYTVIPCRVLDTRQGQGALTSGEIRPLKVTGSCGIPATARAVVVNVTAVQPSAGGSMVLFPADQAVPGTTTISFRAGDNRANNALLLLSTDGTGALSMAPTVGGGGTVHVVVDVSGWYE